MNPNLVVDTNDKGKAKVPNQLICEAPVPDSSNPMEAVRESESPQKRVAKKARLETSKRLKDKRDGNVGSHNEPPIDGTGESLERPDEIAGQDAANNAANNSNPVFPSLHTRTTPSSFCAYLSRLSQSQVDSVISMGFGHLLEMRVRFLPTQMAYWLMENFDYKTSELLIDDNVKIKVTEDDVCRVFGFPKGGEEINRFLYSACNALSMQWVSLFNVRHRDNIKIKAVLDKMLGEVDGGPWFKRHFLIAMQFSLIESYPNGTVHPFVMRCLEDLNVVRKWNWAGYMLKALIQHAQSWADNGKKIFCGPILFLVLVYVDRMHMEGSNVPRTILICVNWSGSELLQRQKLEVDKKYFGSGSLRGPIPLPAIEQLEPANVGRNVAVSFEQSPESLLRSRMLKISREIGEKARFLKSVMLEASVEHRRSLVFKECLVTCSLISGIRLVENLTESTQSEHIAAPTEVPPATVANIDTQNVPMIVDYPVRNEVDTEATTSRVLEKETISKEADLTEFTCVDEIEKVGEDDPVSSESRGQGDFAVESGLHEVAPNSPSNEPKDELPKEHDAETVSLAEIFKVHKGRGKGIKKDKTVKVSMEATESERELQKEHRAETASLAEQSNVQKGRENGIKKGKTVKVSMKTRQSERVRNMTDAVKKGGLKDQSIDKESVKH